MESAASDEAVFDLQYSHFKTTSEEEKCKILDERNASSTNKATKNMVKILEDYIEEKSLPKLEQTADDTLLELLEDFYTDLCQKNGDMYKLASLKYIRAGLNRYFKETRSLDIISDLQFTKTNQKFKGVAKQCRKAGLGSTKSFPVIPDKDMEKLGEYFYQDFTKDPVSPKRLLQGTLFSVMYFTCCTGRENLHEMSPKTYQVYTDATGQKYVTQEIDELDKNHQSDSSEVANTARMFATPGKST